VQPIPGAPEQAQPGQPGGGGTIYPAVSHYPISNPSGRNLNITYASSGKHVISHRVDVSGVSQPSLEATVYLAWPSVHPSELLCICSFLRLSQDCSFFQSIHSFVVVGLQAPFTFLQVLRQPLEYGPVRASLSFYLLEYDNFEPNQRTALIHTRRFSCRQTEFFWIHKEQHLTGGIPNEVVDILEKEYLIRGEYRSGARWYELASSSIRTKLFVEQNNCL
jgi:hypothetical protein